MKRISILGLFFVLALVAGSSFIDRTTAQERAEEPTQPESPQVVGPIRVDDFSYAVGQLTDSNAGANVSGGNWISNTGSGNFLQVSAGSLSYTGYPSSGVGNKLQVVGTTASAEDTFRNFPTQTTGTTYAAFMVNVTDTTGLAANTSTTGDYFAGFISSTSTTSHVARIYIRTGSVPNTYNLGIKGTTTNAVAFQASPTDLPVGTTALLVISYQIVSGSTNDVVNLYINPVITNAEPAPSITQTTLGTDSTDIGRFFIRQGNAGTPNAAVDGLRVATSWAGIIQTYLSPAPVDFNGDGRTDYATFRDNSGQIRWYWKLNGSTDGAEQDFGSPGDTILMKDFDADGKSDITVWRPGTQGFFYILQSSNNTVRTEPFGQTGDDPTVAGDYDGDGKADVAVYRTGAQSFWYYRTAPGGITTFIPWGTAGDTPAPGDYDGDGKMDYVVRRSGTPSIFWRNMSTAGTDIQMFGFPTDVNVPGDYDGDGKTDIAVVRSDGTSYTWFYLPSSGVVPAPAVTFITIPFAAAADVFAQGDYDGDGKTDAAIWRAGIFWVRNSSSGAITPFVFGSPTDGVVAAYNKH